MKSKLIDLGQKLLAEQEAKLVSFQNGHHYKNLIKKHNLEDIAVWQVFGEDNSYGGPFDGQSIPDLGLYKGKLKDVIKEVVILPRFWSWGGGGRIVLASKPKVKIVKAVKPPALDAKEKKIARLEKQLAKLKASK